MKMSLASALFALLAFVLVNVSPAYGADAAAPKKIPFHGKLKAVDTSAQDITIEGKKADRVFYLTSDTKITDGSGNPSTLSAATVGEDVGGSYTKDATGKMTLASVRFGAKAGGKEKAAASAPATAATPASTPEKTATPPPAPSTAAPAAATAAPAAKAKSQRFSGTVVSVDAGSNTLVVHGKADQTFTVTSATKITGASGLAAVTAGAKVSGSYTKSADGTTLTASTLKVTAAK